MLVIFALVLSPSDLCPCVLCGCEGSSLLSGGRECVLVEWRDGAEKNKEFLPRLGSTIEHISVSPAGDLFCTSHSDNSKSECLGDDTLVSSLWTGNGDLELAKNRKKLY